MLKGPCAIKRSAEWKDTQQYKKNFQPLTLFNCVNRRLEVCCFEIWFIMLKFGLFALIGMVWLVRIASAGENGTYLEIAEDLIQHFPRYMEEALRLELKEEEKNRGTNPPDQFWFGRNSCFRDFLRIFNGMRKRKMWAFKGNNHWFICFYSVLAQKCGDGEPEREKNKSNSNESLCVTNLVMIKKG